MSNISKTKKHKSVKFTKWIFFLPIFGVILSIITICIMILRNKPWSILVTLCLSLLVIACVFLHAILKYRIEIEKEIAKKRSMGILFLCMIILFLAVNILYWNIRRIDFKEVTMEQLEDIDFKATEADAYYVIYSTQNCIYCQQMKPIYEEAFLKEKDEIIYTVDLSNERTDEVEVTKKRITGLPVLVKYANGEEIDRLEGVATVDMLLAFMDQ